MREKLIEVRGDKSQSDVAEVLGISQKTLSAIERGYRNPSVELMKKLQDYYKVSMIDLFNDIFKFWYYILLLLCILIYLRRKENGEWIQKYLPNS